MSDMELKPCPFCEHGALHIDQQNRRFFVDCWGCSARGPRAESSDEATLLWNEDNYNPQEDSYNTLRAQVKELTAAQSQSGWDFDMDKAPKHFVTQSHCGAKLGKTVSLAIRGNPDFIVAGRWHWREGDEKPLWVYSYEGEDLAEPYAWRDIDVPPPHRPEEQG